MKSFSSVSLRFERVIREQFDVLVSNGVDVVDHFALHGLFAKKVRRVIDGHDPRFPILTAEPRAPHGRDRGTTAKECASSDIAGEDDDGGINETNLFLEEREVECDLRASGHTIVGRTAFDDIGDIELALEVEAPVQEDLIQ